MSVHWRGHEDSSAVDYRLNGGVASMAKGESVQLTSGCELWKSALMAGYAFLSILENKHFKKLQPVEAFPFPLWDCKARQWEAIWFAIWLP